MLKALLLLLGAVVAAMAASPSTQVEFAASSSQYAHRVLGPMRMSALSQVVVHAVCSSNCSLAWMTARQLSVASDPGEFSYEFPSRRFPPCVQLRRLEAGEREGMFFVPPQESYYSLVLLDTHDEQGPLAVAGVATVKLQGFHDGDTARAVYYLAAWQIVCAGVYMMGACRMSAEHRSMFVPFAAVVVWRALYGVARGVFLWVLGEGSGVSPLENVLGAVTDAISVFACVYMSSGVFLVIPRAVSSRRVVIVVASVCAAVVLVGIPVSPVLSALGVLLSFCVMCAFLSLDIRLGKRILDQHVDMPNGMAFRGAFAKRSTLNVVRTLIYVLLVPSGILCLTRMQFRSKIADVALLDLPLSLVIILFIFLYVVNPRATHIINVRQEATWRERVLGALQEEGEEDELRRMLGRMRARVMALFRRNYRRVVPEEDEDEELIELPVVQ